MQIFRRAILAVSTLDLGFNHGRSRRDKKEWYDTTLIINLISSTQNQIERISKAEEQTVPSQEQKYILLRFDETLRHR